MFISVDIFVSEVKNKDIQYYMVIINTKKVYDIPVEEKIKGKFSKGVDLFYAEGCSSKDYPGEMEHQLFIFRLPPEGKKILKSILTKKIKTIYWRSTPPR